MRELAILLEWDSVFFGRRIARVGGERPSDEEWDALLPWCAENQIECLYFLAQPDDALGLARAARHGFNLVDVRVTLDCAVDRTVSGADARLASAADVPQLKAFTHGAYPHTRFSRDPVLSPLSDRLYETWIQRNVEGRADAVLLVADTEGRPAGFASCHRLSNDEGELGLFGVDRRCRGRGYGARLVSAARNWFYTQGLRRVKVVTNGANIAAQRLYQKEGFRTCKTEYWFHHWL